MKQVDKVIAAMCEAECQPARDEYEDHVYVVNGVPSGRRHQSDETQ